MRPRGSSAMTRRSPATRTKKAEPLIICVNKWDAVEDKDKKEVHRERPRRVQVPRVRSGHVPLRREGAWSTADSSADPRLLRLGIEARDNRRTEPLRRDAEDRAADQDLLHHSSEHPAADLRPLHGQTWSASLFRRAVHHQPSPRAVRVQRYTRRSEGEDQEPGKRR